MTKNASTLVNKLPVEGHSSSHSDPDSSFTPKGAIVFFGLVLTIMVLIWLGAYFVMIKRA